MWPSLFGCCVKFVNSLPFEVSPTVKTGMPFAISWFVMLVMPSELAGSIERQSIWFVLASAWICWIWSCRSPVGADGAIDLKFIGRIRPAVPWVASYPALYCSEKPLMPELAYEKT